MGTKLKTCAHCGTEGILIMADGRCPHCKKSLLEEEEQLIDLQNALTETKRSGLQSSPGGAVKSSSLIWFSAALLLLGAAFLVTGRVVSPKEREGTMMMFQGRGARVTPEQNADFLQKLRDEGYNVPPSIIDDAREQASATARRRRMAHMLYAMAGASFVPAVIFFLLGGGSRLIKSHVIGANSPRADVGTMSVRLPVVRVDPSLSQSETTPKQGSREKIGNVPRVPFIIKGDNMETFSYQTSFKIHRSLQCAWPLIILGGLFVYSLVLADFEGGFREFLTEGWMPLILIGSLAWLILEILWTVSIFEFTVELNEESICVGKTEVSWTDVVKVEYKDAVGKRPAIILSTRSSDDLEIPGAIQGLDYIKGVIKRKVQSHTSSNPSELSSKTEEKEHND